MGVRGRTFGHFFVTLKQHFNASIFGRNGGLLAEHSAGLQYSVNLPHTRCNYNEYSDHL